METVGNHRTRLLPLFTFSSLGAIGLLFPSVGSSLPAIEEYYGVNLSSSGALSSLVQLGYALFCFSGGFLTDYLNKSKVLVLGTLICGTAEILLAFSNLWPLTLFLFLLIGMGSGLIFIASNTLVIELFPKNPGSYLNIHHTFFALGSLIAPLAVSSLLSRGYDWFVVFRVMGILSLALSIMLLISDRGSLRSHPAGGKRTLSSALKMYKEALRKKIFIKLLLTGFMALGVQFGIIYLMVSYLIKVQLHSQNTARLIMSGFFIMLLTGRILCSQLIKKYSPALIIQILLGFLTLTLTIGWLTGGYMSMLMFALTGLASSGLMPTLLALSSSNLEPPVRGAALGFLSMAGGLGGMLMTFTVSGLAGVIGFHRSFFLMIIVSLVTALFFMNIRRDLSRS